MVFIQQRRDALKALCGFRVCVCVCLCARARMTVDITDNTEMDKMYDIIARTQSSFYQHTPLVSLGKPLDLNRGCLRSQCATRLLVR